MKKRIIIPLLAILLFISFYSSQGISLGDNTLDGTSEVESYNTNESAASPAYDASDPISITSNAAFIGVASSGNGTVDDPYIIENLSITNNTANLIYIENTTAYFEIRNCLLNGTDGSYDGIVLNNTDYGNLSTNDIFRCNYGIHLNSSDHNTILNNTVHGNALDGIFLHDSNVTDIFKNKVYDNGHGHPLPLLVSGAGTSGIMTNGNKGSGILIDPSSTNNITENDVYSNYLKGIYIVDCTETTVLNNTIHRNGGDGIALEDSTYTYILNNTIHTNGAGDPLSLLVSGAGTSGIMTNGNKGSGILIDPSNNNYIESNNLSYNGLFGVNITTGSSDNELRWNLFIENNSTDSDYSQAYDDGTNNTFEKNYWYDHNNTDTDGDCIAEDVYLINGTANNSDKTPWLGPSCTPVITTTTTTTATTTTTTTTKPAPGWTVSIILFTIIVLIPVKRKKRKS
ncbi:MAG: nitrous oxide reductase family maturation protein NosD [Candidatus Odinarchaeota archaeon]